MYFKKRAKIGVSSEEMCERSRSFRGIEVEKKTLG
jgi:hypothetical protein